MFLLRFSVFRFQNGLGLGVTGAAGFEVAASARRSEADSARRWWHQTAHAGQGAALRWELASATEGVKGRGRNSSWFLSRKLLSCRAHALLSAKQLCYLQAY